MGFPKSTLPPHAAFLFPLSFFSSSAFLVACCLLYCMVRECRVPCAGAQTASGRTSRACLSTRSCSRTSTSAGATRAQHSSRRDATVLGFGYEYTRCCSCFCSCSCFLFTSTSTPLVHYRMDTQLAHYSAYRTCTRTRSCATQLSELHTRQVHGEAQHQAGQQGLPPGMHYNTLHALWRASLELALHLCSSASCSRWTRINSSQAIRCAACLFLSFCLTTAYSYKFITACV